MFTATLVCGTQLSFEERTFVPATGSMVPCRRHGYCAVTRTGREPDSGRRRLPRSRRRSQDELLQWLAREREVTVHALQRERFSLRMAVVAERAGLIDLDLVSGRIAVRPGGRLA